MRARLSDIALQVEVGEATVSRVLNDRPGVATETRGAVLTALDVLGYERPARLRKRSAGPVGLVVPEPKNPIFPAFTQVIESNLAQSGFTPVPCTQTAGEITQDEYVEMLAVAHLVALGHRRIGLITGPVPQDGEIACRAGVRRPWAWPGDDPASHRR